MPRETAYIPPYVNDTAFYNAIRVLGPKYRRGSLGDFEKIASLAEASKKNLGEKPSVEKLQLRYYLLLRKTLLAKKHSDALLTWVELFKFCDQYSIVCQNKLDNAFYVFFRLPETLIGFESPIQKGLREIMANELEIEKLRKGMEESTSEINKLQEKIRQLDMTQEQISRFQEIQNQVMEAGKALSFRRQSISDLNLNTPTGTSENFFKASKKIGDAEEKFRVTQEAFRADRDVQKAKEALEELRNRDDVIASRSRETVYRGIRPQKEQLKNSAVEISEAVAIYASAAGSFDQVRSERAAEQQEIVDKKMDHIERLDRFSEVQSRRQAEIQKIEDNINAQIEQLEKHPDNLPRVLSDLQQAMGKELSQSTNVLEGFEELARDENIDLLLRKPEGVVQLKALTGEELRSTLQDKFRQDMQHIDLNQYEALNDLTDQCEENSIDLVSLVFSLRVLKFHAARSNIEKLDAWAEVCGWLLEKSEFYQILFDDPMIDPFSMLFYELHLLPVVPFSNALKQFIERADLCLSKYNKLAKKLVELTQEEQGLADCLQKGEDQMNDLEGLIQVNQEYLQRGKIITDRFLLKRQKKPQSLLPEVYTPTGKTEEFRGALVSAARHLEARKGEGVGAKKSWSDVQGKARSVGKELQKRMIERKKDRRLRLEKEESLKQQKIAMQNAQDGVKAKMSTLMEEWNKLHQYFLAWSSESHDLYRRLQQLIDYFKKAKLHGAFKILKEAKCEVGFNQLSCWSDQKRGQVKKAIANYRDVLKKLKNIKLIDPVVLSEEELIKKTCVDIHNFGAVMSAAKNFKIQNVEDLQIVFNLCWRALSCLAATAKEYTDALSAYFRFCDQFGGHFNFIEFSQYNPMDRKFREAYEWIWHICRHEPMAVEPILSLRAYRYREAMRLANAQRLAEELPRLYKKEKLSRPKDPRQRVIHQAVAEPSPVAQAVIDASGDKHFDIIEQARALKEIEEILSVCCGVSENLLEENDTLSIACEKLKRENFGYKQQAELEQKEKSIENVFDVSNVKNIILPVDELKELLKRELNLEEVNLNSFDSVKAHMLKLNAEDDSLLGGSLLRQLEMTQVPYSKASLLFNLHWFLLTELAENDVQYQESIDLIKAFCEENSESLSFMRDEHSLFNPGSSLFKKRFMQLSELPMLNEYLCFRRTIAKLQSKINELLNVQYPHPIDMPEPLGVDFYAIAVPSLTVLNRYGGGLANQGKFSEAVATNKSTPEELDMLYQIIFRLQQALLMLGGMPGNAFERHKKLQAEQKMLMAENANLQEKMQASRKALVQTRGRSLTVPIQSGGWRTKSPEPLNLNEVGLR